MDLKIFLLGDPQIEFQGVVVNGRLPAKACILLYYLASKPKTHDRRQLAELIWEGTANPRNSLRQELAKIIRLLGKDFVLATKNTLAINPDYAYMLDVEEFDNLILLADKVTGATQRAHLRDAITLFRGDFLQDVVVDNNYLYDEWLLPERERLRQDALAAYDRLLEVCRQQGDFEAGIRYALALLQLEPWRESAHRQLIRFYDLTGKRTLAMKQFDALENVLADEFGVSPSDETFALYRQIVDPQPVEVTEPLAGLEKPEKPVPFLAPKLVPHFAGRDAELIDLSERLHLQDKRRLLGLVGPPGVGKTTLAIELAHRLRETFPDGVLWMDADKDDPMSVAERWANAYGYDFSRIPDLQERTAVLRDLLSEKQALIVCDDVTNAAKTRPFLPENCRCTILLTSRSETIIHRLGAELVDVNVLSGENGRSLLASIITEERVAEDEAAAAAILALLEGLPLAIAIAGQWLAMRRRRPLASFAKQLGEESARIGLADKDRAIRTSFAVSWNGLTQVQQRVFALAAVFAGRSFAVNAAAAIVAMDFYEVLERLDDLASLSLLNDVGEERYRQHALLADFAREQLGDDDDPYRRMITYFQAFAADHNEDYAALELEWENLSASIEQAHRLSMWLNVIALTEILRPAWFTRGRYNEARLAFPLVKNAAVALEDKAAIAACLLNWGCACNEQSDYDEAAQLLARSMKAFEDIKCPPGVADAKFGLARIALEQMNLDEADSLLVDVYQLRTELDDQRGVAAALYRQARAAYRRHDQDSALQLLHEALSIYERIGDRAGSMPVLRLLANVSTSYEPHLRDYKFAQECYRKVLSFSEELGDQNERALALRGLSRVCLADGDFQAALNYAQESLEILQKIGDRKTEVLTLRQISKVKAAMGDYKAALQLAEKCLRVSQNFNDGLLLGYIQFEMGGWYIELNEIDLARKFYEDALLTGEKIRNSFLIEQSQAKLEHLGRGV